MGQLCPVAHSGMLLCPWQSTMTGMGGKWGTMGELPMPSSQRAGVSPHSRWFWGHNSPLAARHGGSPVPMRVVWPEWRGAGTLGSGLAEDAEKSGVVGAEKGLPQLARRM